MGRLGLGRCERRLHFAHPGGGQVELHRRPGPPLHRRVRRGIDRLKLGLKITISLKS